MTRYVVEALQPFEIEADHGDGQSMENQAEEDYDDGQSVENQAEEDGQTLENLAEEDGQNRKTRQRDHHCGHCGKNFQVGQYCCNGH